MTCLEGHVRDLDVVERPLAEELDLRGINSAHLEVILHLWHSVLLVKERGGGRRWLLAIKYIGVDDMMMARERERERER